MTVDIEKKNSRIIKTKLINEENVICKFSLII